MESVGLYCTLYCNNLALSSLALPKKQYHYDIIIYFCLIVLLSQIDPNLGRRGKK